VSFVLEITINIRYQMWISQMKIFAVGNGVFAINRSDLVFVDIPKSYICNKNW
jgi:hypothetical protein